MDQLAEVVKNGLSLSAAQLPLLSEITIWFRIDGDTADYAMINGQTTLDGISCSRSDNTLTITRIGANLDIENTSGSSFTVNAVAITGGSIGSGIDFREILPVTTVADIEIPDGQVARISDISFNLVKQP